MLRIYSRKADIGIHERSEFESIAYHLTSLGYDPVIRNMISESYKTAKLSPPNQHTLSTIMRDFTHSSPYEPDTFSGGDLFFKDDSLFVVFPNYDHTIVSIIGFEEELNILDQFCEDFKKCVTLTFDGRRMRGAKFNWRETSDFQSSRFDPYYATQFRNPFYGDSSNDSQKFEKPEYSENEVISSKLLCDSKLRSFMQKVGKYSKMSKRDAETELADTAQLEILLENDLISKEFLIRCVQDQRTICTVPSLEILKNESNSNVKCPTCRRSLSDEHSIEVYTISDKGRNLMRGSRWMSIWVTEELTKHGIKRDLIDWRIEENGEEIDIRISDFNSKVLLELKDREFGAGDTHPFIYRVDKYHGTIGCILTTHKISPDAKIILRDQQSKIHYRLIQLEGVKGIENGLRKMVNDVSIMQITSHIRPFSTMYGSLVPMVNTWAIRKISHPPSFEISLSSDKSQSELEHLKNKTSLEN